MTLPDISGQTQGLADWFSTNGVLLLVFAFVLLLVYGVARPAIHRFLVAVAAGQAGKLGASAAQRSEIERRVATAEDLLVKLLRTLVIGGLVVLLLGALNMWSILAGMGLVLAAITLAGQEIVLDYLMGLLILLEGQYFKGDIVNINGTGGTVEEVGLRRTVLRDFGGVVHSISNGVIRTSSNMTRTYAVPVVLVEGIADQDVDATIRVLNAVGREMAADPAFAEAFIETPAYTGITGLTALGATLRLSGRVQPDARWRVEFEMRRRAAVALAANGIEPIRPMVRPAPAP